LIRTARFWAHRASSGPRSATELLGLAASTILLTFMAPLWRAWGFGRAMRVAPRGRADRWGPRPPALVLFDRDGTLIHDVPYNGDPARVVPVPGAQAALNRLREAGVAVGMITNQSGVGRGLISIDDVHASNARTEHLLGPFAVVEVCPHLEVANCGCRKPAPGMVVEAARRLGVAPERCAVVGDIGSDVRAAVAAGARGLLVPTLVTSADEIVEAPEVVSSLGHAVDVLLGTRVRS
jgi:HAD superfamily hydrolase (TIGR01662 family)